MRQKTLFGLGLAGMIMCLPVTAFAEEILSQSRITDVTVFPTGAEITRAFSVDLPTGSHELVLKDLPARLDGRSLAIEGAGPQGLEIGTIDHKVETVPFGEQPTLALRRQLQERLDRLRDERQLINAEIEAAKLQKQLLLEMTKLPGQQAGHGQGGVPIDLSSQYSSLFALMGEKFVDAEKRSIEALVKLRALDEEIKTLSKQISEQPQATRQVTRLTVNVVAGKAGSALFQVRYHVRNAGWRPLYEARLKTDGEAASKLALVRRAEIYQNSQEDWSRVRLKLSTSNPRGRTQAPELFPWLVDFMKERKPKPPVPLAGAVQEKAENDRMISEFSMKADRRIRKSLALEAPAAKPRAVKQTLGSYHMVFEVQDAASVKRNGERKKVFLDVIDLEPKVRLYTVPKKGWQVYLHAEFANKTDNGLLAGDLALFRDGVYVGRSYLKAVAPGEDTNIGFGADPNVTVKWVRLDRVKGETGIISSSNSDVHRYKITLTSGHKKPMPVTIFDQMPYANQEQLQISLLNASPKPTRTNVDDKKGVMAWDLVAKPNKPLVVEFSYQLVWPKDKKITLR